MSVRRHLFGNSMEDFDHPDSKYRKKNEQFRRLCIIGGVVVFLIICIAIFSTSSSTERDPESSREFTPIIPIQFTSEKLVSWYEPQKIHGSENGPGELGKPVEIPADLQEKMKERFKEHEFNIMASDMISANRSLIDTRNPKCADKKYPDRLPTASVVIVFHNEAWSTLDRTLWSIINRSPQSLLREIILVDDASDMEHLGRKLDTYVAQLPIRTMIVRTGNRTGLIRGRLLGAQRVTSQAMVFMDAHCECNDGWLPPLLARLVENRQIVASPVIDVISDETLEYKRTSDAHCGGFDSHIAFKWAEIPEREQKRRYEDSSEPIRTPTIAGGLFAIDREYFYELGTYDEGMEIWGSENLEMSFRVWMCGGMLEIVPCSRVGHIFRKNTPYTFIKESSAIIRQNTARLVEVWLDEYRGFFEFTYNYTKTSFGDVSARKALRKKLNCKSFQWYLQHIYPESPLPLNFQYLGDLENVGKGLCLDAEGKEETEAGVHSCHHHGGNQLMVYTKEKQIRSYDLCLDAEHGTSSVWFKECKDKDMLQKWLYNQKDRSIKSIKYGKCLTATKSSEVVLSSCNKRDKYQQWMMNSPQKSKSD